MPVGRPLRIGWNFATAALAACNKPLPELTELPPNSQAAPDYDLFIYDFTSVLLKGMYTLKTW